MPNLFIDKVNVFPVTNPFHKAMNVVSGKYFIFRKQINTRYFTFINCFAFK